MEREKSPEERQRASLVTRADASAKSATAPPANPSPTPVLMLRSGRTVPLVSGESHGLGHDAVDICFVFDTTGSMSDKIDGLVRCTVDLVQELDGLRRDWRAVSVPFGDLTVPGDRIITDLPFVNDRSAAETQLRAMPRFSGGGNQGESSIEAMSQALARKYRPDAVKVFVLLTDEPALISPEARPDDVTRRLREAEVICFVASPDLPYYREWAAANGGTWFHIAPVMDFAVIVELLRSLVRRVASVADAVHQLGQGSVRRYLELTSGSDQA